MNRRRLSIEIHLALLYTLLYVLLRWLVFSFDLTENQITTITIIVIAFFCSFVFSNLLSSIGGSKSKTVHVRYYSWRVILFFLILVLTLEVQAFF
jgi:hypothetical protein